MNTLLRNMRKPAAVVWLILAAATILSWRLGTDHGIFFDDRMVAGTLVLLIAFGKVVLVGTHFMELRTAPRGLLGLFTGWAAAVCLGLIGYYLMT